MSQEFSSSNFPQEGDQATILQVLVWAGSGYSQIQRVSHVNLGKQLRNQVRPAAPHSIPGSPQSATFQLRTGAPWRPDRGLIAHTHCRTDAGQRAVPRGTEYLWVLIASLPRSSAAAAPELAGCAGRAGPRRAGLRWLHSFSAAAPGRPPPQTRALPASSRLRPLLPVPLSAETDRPSMEQHER